MMGYNGAVDGVVILDGLAVLGGREKDSTERSVDVPVMQFSQAPRWHIEADIAPIIRRAIEVIGDREEAMRWLGTPVRALDYATPISCIHDPISRQKVLSVLTQLEHGVL
jgi:putative toxin-antitoxin system antitoxin component (TIGR02293 family)